MAQSTLLEPIVSPKKEIKALAGLKDWDEEICISSDPLRIWESSTSLWLI